MSIEDFASAIEMVAAERIRQVRTIGHTGKHDDSHVRGELMAAAACYLSAAMCITAPDDPRAAPATYDPPVAPYWPWEPETYKPSMSDPVRNLVKAGALIIAEIERLQRLEADRG